MSKMTKLSVKKVKFIWVNLQAKHERQRLAAPDQGPPLNFHDIYTALKKADALGANDWVIKLGEDVYPVYTCGK